MQKSELAIKRDEWFESDEGKKCSDASILSSDGVENRKFLKNRLEYAFLARAKANEEVATEICKKLVGTDWPNDY